MRNHILIAGTGRAGTSLLVRILDACGLETEISRQNANPYWNEDANAGIESIALIGDDHPYVVKSPWSYQFIEELLAHPDIKLEAVYIPIRDLADAAASRIILDIQNRYRQNSPDLFLDSTWRDWGHVPGGAIYSLEPLDQARILAHSFHRLVDALTRHEIPIRFLAFPRFVYDIPYLYRALGEIIQHKFGFDEFRERVLPIIDPDLVRVDEQSRPAETTTEIDPHSESSGHRNPVSVPDFDTLDRTALKREVRRLARECERLARECERLAAKARRRTVTGRILQFKDFISPRKSRHGQ